MLSDDALEEIQSEVSDIIDYNIKDIKEDLDCALSCETASDLLANLKEAKKKTKELLAVLEAKIQELKLP